jgi:L-ribulokinase
LALDWFNGRRTPDANATLKGAITGLSLGSDAPRIFRALAEATAFGARAIVERFQQQGIPVKGLIGIGGIANKSPFLMQLLADVIGMEIKINRCEQTAALGASMFAATVAGIYPRVEDAMRAMGQGFDQAYMPNNKNKFVYELRYRKYQELGKMIEHL